MNLHKINEEIFIAEDQIVRIGDEEIAFLKQQAQASPRKRARICAHKTNDNALHEMLIAIYAESYIHPHKHLGKSESFHIVEGVVDIVVFDDGGAIREVIALGDTASGRSFYYRLSDSYFHTLLIRSEVLVVHEVTNGPFLQDDAVLAPFAPPEDRRDEAKTYIAAVTRAVAQGFTVCI